MILAFDLEQIGGYGTGTLGDVKISEGATQTLNSYARVVGIDANTITIDTETMTLGAFEQFRAGEEILVHCSATNRGTPDYLGKYMVAKILLVTGNILTLDKTMFTVDLNYEYVQAVTVANFDCLTLGKGAVVTPPPYNPFHHHGGIVALKCWDTLKFDGGSINLVDCGIPANRKNALRPAVLQETPANGESDFALLSGQENFMTADKLVMNAGDGVAFIVAKKLIISESSRIGNPNTHGAQFCRGASNSVGVKPANITNVGGSTIFIAAETIEKFSPKMIAKYRNVDLFEGRGLCRCYIASNTKLRADEGLYAYDVLSNPVRLQEFGVKDFGDGSFGDLENPTAPLNNYAHVVSIQQDGYRLKIAGETLRGLAPIKTGALVLVQVIQLSTQAVSNAGKISVARVLDRTNDAVILDFPAPQVDLNRYAMQIISIPQFDNLTISGNYDKTTAFGSPKGGVTSIGGVCAVACANTLNLSGGRINVEGKGGAVGYGKRGLAVISNAGCNDRLPLGEGHGSVFILTKKLICDENSRIGATYSGAGAGRFGGSNYDNQNAGGGYSGAPDEDGGASGGGYIGGGAGSSDSNSRGLGGSGAAGGTLGHLNEFIATEVTGGYGSSGKPSGKYAGGSQGSHVMIIADSCAGLSVANISTGGDGGKTQNAQENGKPGAAGFGGGGAKNGSSGGSGGFAFVYANNVA